MILVTGATGFIGRHLLADFSHIQDEPILGLSRRDPSELGVKGSIKFIQGDLSDQNKWASALEPGATLVNLAYSNVGNLQDAADMAARLANTCADAKIKRFIHCSSVSVYGRVSGLVNEEVPCNSHGHYSRAKLDIEQSLIENTRDRFELVILRPTEVFGIGGKGLNGLIQSLVAGSSSNYVRSSLFGNRQMHLLPVAVMTAAIRFFCNDARQYSNEIFNVSMDEHTLNNFRSIECILMEELGMSAYRFPPVPIPAWILRTVLRVSRRAAVDDQVRYSSIKLMNHGFYPDCDFEMALRNFVSEYQKTNLLVKAFG